VISGGFPPETAKTGYCNGCFLKIHDKKTIYFTNEPENPGETGGIDTFRYFTAD
jgi:hypothetical protein